MAKKLSMGVVQLEVPLAITNNFNGMLFSSDIITSGSPSVVGLI